MVETFPLGMAGRYACGFRGNLGTRASSLLPALRLRTICGNSARAWVRPLLKVDMRGLRGSDAKRASYAYRKEHFVFVSQLTNCETACIFRRNPLIVKAS